MFKFSNILKPSYNFEDLLLLGSSMIQNNFYEIFALLILSAWLKTRPHKTMISRAISKNGESRLFLKLMANFVVIGLIMQKVV